MKRLLLVLVVLLPLVAGPATAAAQPAAQSATLDAPAQPLQAENTTNESGTPAATPTEQEAETETDPTTASQVRITPVTFEQDFLDVTVNASDSSYQTSGPFAVFSLSERVEAARITQSPAQAEVLAGGRQVRVNYDEDAAPTGGESLYTLELFFADGSSRTIDLYAQKTGVSVAASDLEEYQPVINELIDLAEEHDYGSSPEELESYLEWVNDRADLIEGFLTQKALQLLATAYSAVTNWLFWIIALVGIGLIAKWIQRRYGGFLEALQNDVGRAERQRRELRLDYEESKQTADEVPLEDVPAVGANAIYWRDGHGVRSAGQLARLAAHGAHRQTEDGLEKVHDGAADLDVDNLGDSWLEPVTREDRIPTAKQALGEIKATLEFMETEHNLGHLYRDARDDIARLIEQLNEDEKMLYGPGNHHGGDD
ncbi:hypothetical protein [Haloarcula sediminis]|uniref:hypothetical protein n=1 Tax=Haloarcula sediminis TaxID=3111777 RepID=UPI002D789CBF|nr:hypothetical protein [Haloarcula sp. CK38]